MFLMKGCYINLQNCHFKTGSTHLKNWVSEKGDSAAAPHTSVNLCNYCSASGICTSCFSLSINAELQSTVKFYV